MAVFRHTSLGGTRRNAGFTLVELMVVCVIIAFMAALVAPNFRSYFVRAQRDKAKSDLTNTVRGAIYRATQSRQVRVLAIHVEKGTYDVQSPPDRNRRGPWKTDARRVLPQGFVFASVYRTELEQAHTRGEVIIEIRPNGTTEDFELVVAEMDKSGTEVIRYFLMTVAGSTGHIAWTDLRKDEVRYTARW